jgi:hypothetical protein
MRKRGREIGEERKRKKEEDFEEKRGSWKRMGERLKGAGLLTFC